MVVQRVVICLCLVAGLTTSCRLYKDVAYNGTSDSSKKIKSASKCYRLSLSDKKYNDFSLNHPELFLSIKAIERRKRQHIPIDSLDLPVSRTYIDQVRNTGVKIVQKSKWNNSICILCSDSDILNRIRTFPFVLDVKCVADYRFVKNASQKEHKTAKSIKLIPHNGANNQYGYGYKQIDMLNGIFLHNAGFRGNGMSIAVIDAGFKGMNVIPYMKQFKILGSFDFVEGKNDVFSYSDHGLMVASCMGINVPNTMIGTAPEAGYWLLRSENTAYEQLIEEDNWAAAVEFADSVGVDVINSSIGYVCFDDTMNNITGEDLCNKSHMISREASMIADKGMILCNSAGNYGNKKWGYLSIPAEVDDILSVGAVDSMMGVTSFSSRNYSNTGNSIKPDVVAMGKGVNVVTGQGSIYHADGTSLASPIVCGLVACLWQAFPNLTAKDIISVVRKSGNRHSKPDDSYGYGVPDFMKALFIAENRK